METAYAEGGLEMVRSCASAAALIAVLAPAVLLISGRPEAPLRDYKRAQSEAEFQQIYSAPLVIVGKVLSDKLLMKPVPSCWDRVPLQLRKADIQVENILRGEAIPDRASIYYFTWAGGFDGPRPLGFRSSDRRILWLRRDSGALRTACDGWDYCTMPVHSGAHRNYRPDPGKPLGYALAAILLTRGEGAADRQFAAALEWGSPGTVPEPYLFQKLRQLAAAEAPLLRDAACKQLSYYRQPCVPAATHR